MTILLYIFIYIFIYLFIYKVKQYMYVPISGLEVSCNGTALQRRLSYIL